MYYVYAHLYNKSIFYIGLGGKNRPYDRRARNLKWSEMVNTNGPFNIEIMACFVDREDGCLFEKEMIEKYNPVCNIFKTGYRQSESSKFLRSISLKNTIGKLKEDGKYIKPQHITREHKERISKAVSKPIICNESGLSYKSATEAGRLLGIDNANITAVLTGKRARTHSLTFSYLSNNIGTKANLT